MSDLTDAEAEAAMYLDMAVRKALEEGGDLDPHLIQKAVDAIEGDTEVPFVEECSVERDDADPNMINISLEIRMQARG